MVQVQLTPREIEVLKLVADGASGKEVAEKLGIAFRTARSHRSNLMEKLDLHDTAGLVRYAIRTGLIQA
jgi:DNA-binding NarL/FixJ family response regulator